MTTRLAARSLRTRLAAPWGRLEALTRLPGVWAARAREREELAAMDDHRLADLGITREQAAREAAKPFWFR